MMGLLTQAFIPHTMPLMMVARLGLEPKELPLLRRLRLPIAPAGRVRVCSPPSFGLFRTSCGQETHPPALFFLAWILSVPRSPMRTRLFPLAPACPSHPGGSLISGGTKKEFNHGYLTVQGEALPLALIPCGTSGAGSGTRTRARLHRASALTESNGDSYAHSGVRSTN